MSIYIFKSLFIKPWKTLKSQNSHSFSNWLLLVYSINKKVSLEFSLFFLYSKDYLDRLGRKFVFQILEHNILFKGNLAILTNGLYNSKIFIGSQLDTHISNKMLVLFRYCGLINDCDDLSVISDLSVLNQWFELVRAL